jgi:NADPH:quinone reductase
MHAVIISQPGDPDVLKLQELPDPTINDNEVLIQVAGAGVNRADLLQRRGLYPSPEGYRDELPGLEISGIIIRLGKNVPDKWRINQEVMALVDGEGYASLAAVDYKMLMPVPKNVSLLHAAAIPEVFLTAYDALVLQCGLKQQDKILVHAAGSGVGTAAIQIASRFNCDIYGTASNDDKLTFAKSLGLNHGINYNTDKFDDYISNNTNKSGVDIILDVVGSNYFEQNINSLSIKGRMIVIGLLGGDKVNLSLSKILRRRLHIIGTVLRSRSRDEKIVLTNEFSVNFLDYFYSNNAKPIVDKVFPAAEANQAHTFMEKNLNTGKIILDFTV